MNANDKIRLRHMLQYARSARSFIKNETRQTVDEDEMLQFALVRALEVIGEAASKVTKETQNQLPQIRWAAIIGMRNVLIHGYVSIDLDIV